MAEVSRVTKIDANTLVLKWVGSVQAVVVDVDVVVVVDVS